jgi:hypothetical protein
LAFVIVIDVDIDILSLWNIVSIPSYSYLVGLYNHELKNPLNASVDSLVSQCNEATTDAKQVYTQSIIILLARDRLIAFYL